MRTVPGQDHQAILREIENLIRDLGQRVPDFKASAKIINDRPPVETPADNPAVGIFAEAIRDVTGKTPAPKGTRYFTDGVVFAPALKAPLLICGPGAPELAHQPNESIDIEKFIVAMRIYTAALLRFLG